MIGGAAKTRHSTSVAVGTKAVYKAIIIARLPRNTGPKNNRNNSKSNNRNNGNSKGRNNSNSKGRNNSNSKGRNNSGANSSRTMAAVTSLGGSFIATNNGCRVRFASTIIACMGNPGTFVRSTANNVLLCYAGRNLTTKSYLGKLTSKRCSVFENLPRLASVSNTAGASNTAVPYGALALTQLLTSCSQCIDYHVGVRSIAVTSTIDNGNSAALSRNNSSRGLCIRHDRMDVRTNAKSVVICPSCCGDERLKL